MDFQKIYKNRFGNNKNLERKNKIWKVLCHSFFQRFIPKDAFIVDIAAGYCEFINNISAGRKIAFDLNQGGKNFAGEDVVFVNKSFFEMSEILSTDKPDILFCSHILEHLKDKDEVVEAFKIFSQNLKKGGKLFILQPNIRYAQGKYWDFIDHRVPLTEKSLIEAGNISGFKKNYCLTKFLPFSTKSKKPQFSWIVWVYLKMLPVSGYFFGQQSFLILEKEND